MRDAPGEVFEPHKHDADQVLYLVEGTMKFGAESRPNGRKRTYRFKLPSLRTLRFELIHLPGRIARPHGVRQLRIAAAPAAQERIRAIERRLAA